MDLAIIEVFIILGLTIVFFVTELFPVDKIAIFIIVALILLGLVSPEEGISGFSNTATITVLALMILAIALEDNGVIAWFAQGLQKLSILPLILLIPIFMFISAGISAFISTTAVVIVFIKIIFQLSERFGIPSGKLLLPVSFAGILGGSCTLMGTSTNLIVNSIAQNRGIEKLAFFEFAWLGGIFLVIGIIVVSIASRFLPSGNASENLEKSYKLDELITTLSITKDSTLIGKSIADSSLLNNSNVTLLKLVRKGIVTNAPGKYITLAEGDRLVLMADLETVGRISSEEGLSERKAEMTESETKESEDTDIQLVEVLVLPGSSLIGNSLSSIKRYKLEGALPVAIKKRKNIRNTTERLIRKDLDQIRIKSGDRILLEITQAEVHNLEHVEGIAVLKTHESLHNTDRTRTYISAAILIIVIGFAASGLLSILASSLTGIALLLATNSLQMDKIYHKVDWQIFFLLAGMIPLGVAMTNSGADVWLSQKLLMLFEGKNHLFILGALFSITMVLSGCISNNATAVIMTPIAITVASGLELSAKPFILAVLFAASFSFFTPVGYQTNTLIYSLGIYKFKHFLIVGGLLSLILCVVATFLLSEML
ncbi:MULTISPECIES: SLC13 family permease [unclassified Leeuwenhoekiella]|uniref:SLC13 family permease n=1 Tax=unclassified Leeuwenhoekiella TaxID=2615029 RepID=UPI000C5FE911|nr:MULTISPECIES: SLC13 family permease [unclassified Leeuwenhoekiella]MAW95030.1 SLC13 family permease [Leeuwenhoekiella sp.]MBA79750.1 SLC13 family permease [Leeuwenhoekiella sp.]|tara:strand:+ start:16842 stop:18641 length:1800 start_codon:yes stop_codon:yes gene_type:complete